MFPLQVVKTNPSLPLHSFWCLSAILGVFWLVAVIIPISAFVFTCVSSPLHIKTPTIEFRVHPNSAWPLLNIIISAKPLFPNKVSFTGIKGWKCSICFLETHSPYNNTHASQDKASCCFSGPVVRGFLVFTVFISFHSVFQSLPARFQVTDPLLRNGQEVYEYNQHSYYPGTLMVTSMQSCRFYPCKRNLNRTYFQLEVPLINWYSKMIQFELLCPMRLNKINLKYHWSCKSYRCCIMKPAILHNMSVIKGWISFGKIIRTYKKNIEIKRLHARKKKLF